MKHSFIDKYSDLDSLIHRLDPRTKIVCLLLYVIFIVLTSHSDFLQLGFYLIFIFIAIYLSKVPFFYITKRSLVIIPVVLLIVVFVPFLDLHFNLKLMITGNVLIKSWLSILAMILLSSTTRFTVLLKGMELLKFPKILIMVFSFMYRYIFVLLDEVMKMKQAYYSRYYGGKFFKQFKILGNIIGFLFIRTYERGERIYYSMVSRGLTHEIKLINNLKFKTADSLFLTTVISILILVKLGSILCEKQLN